MKKFLAFVLAMERSILTTTTLTMCIYFLSLTSTNCTNKIRELAAWNNHGGYRSQAVSLHQRQKKLKWQVGKIAQLHTCREKKRREGKREKRKRY